MLITNQIFLRKLNDSIITIYIISTNTFKRT